MKNLTIFFVTALLAIAFCSSCSKDDSSSSAPYTSGSTGGSNGSGNNSKSNKEIITSNTWKFNQLLLNNNDANFGSYKPCEVDNEWLFRGKELKIISRGSPCKNGESNGGVYRLSSWDMVNDDDFTMAINGETFTIINISKTTLMLRVKRKQGSNFENWDYIYIAK